MIGKKQLLIDLLVVLVFPLLLIAGYFYLWKGGDDLSGTTSTPGLELAAKGAKVKEALAIIRSVKFDTSIFSDPLFNQLEDQTVEPVNVPVGRDNPFTLPDTLSSQTMGADIKSAPAAKPKVSASDSLELTRQLTR